MSNPKVELHIKGHAPIVIELDNDKAPVSVANFLHYVESGHYNGTIFHRVIQNFMIQGGGMESGMKQKKVVASIKNEADNGLKNNKYTLAMARTSDPHSATAQFFINTTDNDFLNFSAPTQQGWGYAVFGKVISGADVIDKLNTASTGRSGMHDDVPVDEILLEKAVQL